MFNAYLLSYRGRFSRFCMIQYLRHDTVLDEGRLVSVSVVKEDLLFVRFLHKDLS